MNVLRRFYGFAYIGMVFFGMWILVVGCKPEVKPIEYGKDVCHFCNMTIVDKAHAAQYVTKKGKNYKFDAIECMIRQILQEDNMDALAIILVADYAHPGVLVPADEAVYLISEGIRSPMGANLSAFSSKEEAEKALQTHGGQLYNWSEILDYFRQH